MVQHERLTKLFNRNLSDSGTTIYYFDVTTDQCTARQEVSRPSASPSSPRGSATSTSTSTSSASTGKHAFIEVRFYIKKVW